MIRTVNALSIIFWVTIMSCIRSIYGQDCDRFNTSRIPENDPSSSLEMDHFSCADGEFLMSVDVWYSFFLGELRWTCSDGDTSYFPEELGAYLNYSRVTFGVGLTTVETSFRSDIYDSFDSRVYLGDCYIGGYNVSTPVSTLDGVIFVRSGPFGTGDNYTEQRWSSSCPNDSYATGATWWTSPAYNFVNGIQLECAGVTSTCYPPGLENQGADDDLTGTEEYDATDDIDTTVADDTSSGTEMVTIIAAGAVGAAIAVVAIAAITGICFFFDSKRNRESAKVRDSQVHRETTLRIVGDPPEAVRTSQIVEPTAPVYPPASIEHNPAHLSQDAPAALFLECFPRTQAMLIRHNRASVVRFGRAHKETRVRPDSRMGPTEKNGRQRMLLATGNFKEATMRVNRPFQRRSIFYYPHMYPKQAARCATIGLNEIIHFLLHMITPGLSRGESRLREKAI